MSRRKRLTLAAALALLAALMMVNTGCFTPQYSGYYDRGGSIHADSFPSVRYEDRNYHGYGRPYYGY